MLSGPAGVGAADRRQRRPIAGRRGADGAHRHRTLHRRRPLRHAARPPTPPALSGRRKAR